MKVGNWIPWVIVGVLIVILLSPTIMTYLKPGTTVGPQQPENMIAIRLPWKFSVIDKLGGDANLNGTVYVYDLEGNLMESVTITNGQGTSANEYMSGDKYNILVQITNFVSVWYNNVEVPFETTDQATTHYTQLQTVDLGTFSFIVYDDDGNAITNGGNYNKTSGGNIVTFDITLRNTEDDSGFMSSYDPLEGYWDRAMLVFKITGTGAENVVVLSSGYQYKEVGNDRYFFMELSDNNLIRDKKPDGTVEGGAYSISFQLDLTSYSGDLADLAIMLVLYSSGDYFNYYGSFGSDAVTTTFTINLVD